MRISAKADYAVRAALELASGEEGEPVKGDAIAEAQGIPLKFLENILGEISLADIVRAVEGPLATVRGQGPESLEYEGEAANLQKVWIALRTNIREVMDEVTLADICSDELPARVRELSEPAEAWSPR